MPTYLGTKYSKGRACDLIPGSHSKAKIYVLYNADGSVRKSFSRKKELVLALQAELGLFGEIVVTDPVGLNLLIHHTRIPIESVINSMRDMLDDAASFEAHNAVIARMVRHGTRSSYIRIQLYDGRFRAAGYFEQGSASRQVSYDFAMTRLARIVQAMDDI